MSSTPARRLVAFAAALLAMTLSGCYGTEFLPRSTSGGGEDPDGRSAAATKQKFAADVTIGQTVPGTETPQAPRNLIDGLVHKGSFKAALKKAGKASYSTVRLDISSGSFVVRSGGQTDASNGTATAKGLGLVSFSSKKAGRTCFSFEMSFTNFGANATGTFKTVGGSGKAAKVKGSGNFTYVERDRAQGKGTIDGTLRARELAAPKALPPACKKLPG